MNIAQNQTGMVYQQRRQLKLNFRKKEDVRQSSNLDDAQLIFNSRDLPYLKENDLVKLTSVDDERVTITLKAGRPCDNNSVPKNTVCISEEIILSSSYFAFKRYSEVFVEQIAQPQEAALDLLELTFREQYVSRSDMCRIRRFVRNRCVFLDAKIEYCLMRLKVRELWRKGECVTCGQVDESTRVVFRSSSALMFIFIQMSAEMWDFDTQGVCYYEKCFDGFLPELFKRWRQFKCSHYVTIVLFSRWFYKNCDSLERDFPRSEAHKIQRDYRGRFYQDFYHVLIQNEHYEDWTCMVPKLRESVLQHDMSVKKHMLEKSMPEAENSAACDGNVLEAFNMGFNVFAPHYVDRTFERTGQALVLVTPGGGVFNVDRTFANVTKQRNFDHGIAVDLVMLGEQPLHAVPLLIYHSRTTARGRPPEIEDYFIMHWVNYSYYNPVLYPNPLGENFRPRVTVPFEMLQQDENVLLAPPNIFPSANTLSSYPDFEAYDNYIYAAIMPKRRQHKTSVPQISPTFKLGKPRRQRSDDESSDTLPPLTAANRSSSFVFPTTSNLDASSPINELPLLTFGKQNQRKKLSGSFPIKIAGHKATPATSPTSDESSCPTVVAEKAQPALANRSTALTQGGGPLSVNVGASGATGTQAQNRQQHILPGSTAPTRGFYSPSFTSTGELGPSISSVRVGSAEGRFYSKQSTNFLEPEEVRRPLINPFKPSEFSVRITSNRRRWIHVFPVDSRGLSKQSHHFVAGTSIIYADLQEPDPTEVPEAPLMAIDSENDSAEIVAMRQKSPEKLSTLKESSLQVPSNSSGTLKGKTLIWAWGCTGEEQWNPDIEVGTDWRSMVVPSCLPITTDFFPDARSLKYDYLFSEHIILLDELVRELWTKPAPALRNYPQCMHESDFRICVFNELVAQRLQQGFQVVLLPLDMLNSAIAIGCGPTLMPEKVCYLSISRIFHRLALVGQCIYVTKFFPRHLYSLKAFTCLYECQVPDSNCYQTTTTKFEHDSLEKVNWSSIDNLILQQGDTDDYVMQRDMKFWEARFFLVASGHPATQKIITGGETQCDIYSTLQAPDLEPMKLLDSFVKFMEILNRIRRPPNTVRFGTRNPNLTSVVGNDLIKIVALANSQEYGLNFLTNTSSVPATAPCKGNNNATVSTSPERLFVSAEFSHWLIGHVTQIDTVQSAVNLAQRLLAENLIRHVTNQESRFVYGFYLYYFVNPLSNDRVVDCNFNNLNQNGTNVYYEVAVVDPCQLSTSSNFCHRRFKTYKFNFDPMRRSERLEWGQIRINRAFCPGTVFEVNFNWLVATGAIVNETVMQLHRKSVVYPLCLLPVPKDPFALPDDPQSDPQRCPIFLPLNEEKVGALSLNQLDQLRLEILKRYGFVAMACEVHASQQFFHRSAGMSVMLKEPRGFLWKWNHALGHRYRTPTTTGDEKYLDKMLADFRVFCRDADGRLGRLIENLFFSIDIPDS